MAVFTAVSSAQLEAWLAKYDLGKLLEFQGITSGIENSNFFVSTQRGSFVLTLFERLPAEALPFYLGLMHHLAQRAIPCPDPVPDRAGRLLGELNGKPAALVTRLAGSALDLPSVNHCRKIGELLGRMHLAAQDYPGTMVNARGIDWQQEQVGLLAKFLVPESAELLQDELRAQLAFHGSSLE
ncbi:MAG: phosphotransferase, partial [Quisquiliibacterium sp.]